MILELQHKHVNLQKDYTEEEFYQEPISVETAKYHGILNEIKSKSQIYLGQQTISEINEIRKLYEDKVYLCYSTDSVNEYLYQILQKKKQQTKDHVAFLLEEKQRQINHGIANEVFQLKINNGNNIKQIREQLMDKLSNIKSGLQSLPEMEQRKIKGNIIYENYLEFRRKGYWNQKSEQSVKVSKFLRKMNKFKHQLSQKYSLDLKRREQKIKEEQNKKIKEKQEERKRHLSESVDRLSLLKKQRLRRHEEQEAKKIQANKFLKQYQQKKLRYIVMEEQFKKQIAKNQQELQEKINQIKKEKRQIGKTEEIQEHAQRYEEFRKKLQEIQVRRQQQRQINLKNELKLKELFHGHYHQLNTEQDHQNRMAVRLGKKKQQRSKMFQYASCIEENYRPIVDPRKRQELQNSIRQLELKEDKSKRKKVTSDGIVTYEDKLLYDPKAIGKSYLSQLRIENEGKVKKTPQQRSISLKEINKKQPAINYLAQIRGKNGKSTLSNWKNVIKNKSMTSQDKYESVMEKVEAFEIQAKQKEIELRNVKNDKAREIQLKQQLDKYYLQSVAAKMVVLKDVILK